jgi:hypothetical protein
MVDLSLTHGQLTPASRVAPHSFMPFCRKPWEIPGALIRIHHHYGSWETVGARRDRRGLPPSREAWETFQTKGEC